MNSIYSKFYGVNVFQNIIYLELYQEHFGQTLGIVPRGVLRKFRFYCYDQRFAREQVLLQTSSNS